LTDEDGRIQHETLNVLITGHQGFFTEEALQSIAETTIANLSEFETAGRPIHQLAPETHVCPASSERSPES